MSEIVNPWAVVDDLSFIHNMVGKTGVHSQATYLQATGFQFSGFRARSWVSYGLGSNEDLPSFVVFLIIGFCLQRAQEPGSAFATYTSTIFPQRTNPIEDLHPYADYLTDESHGEGSIWSTGSTACTSALDLWILVWTRGYEVG